MVNDLFIKITSTLLENEALKKENNELKNTIEMMSTHKQGKSCFI